MATAGELSNNLLTIDQAYEFDAPQFYDFICGESDEDVCKAELWFETTLSYAPSPFMPRIKSGRSVQLQSLCNFDEDEQPQKVVEPLESATSNTAEESASKQQNLTKQELEHVPALLPKEEVARNLVNMNSEDNHTENADCAGTEKVGSISAGKTSSSSTAKPVEEKVDCTPAAQAKQTDVEKVWTAKKIASLLRNPSALKQKNRLQQSQIKSNKQASVKREGNVKHCLGASTCAQENQAIKRQKLEGGKSRQILTISKPSNLPHKTKSGLISDTNGFCSSALQGRKVDRKIYSREPASSNPFISMAEMIKKFQSSTRDLSLPCISSLSQRKPKLTLTRPKEPEFETSHRVRPVKIKSSAELEEEMLATIPKFKARPLNKKILEAPTLPALQRSKPQPPDFKEFQLETMLRANQNAETSSVASAEFAHNHQWKPHLTTPKSPLLQTSMRARPINIRSSEEELEKIQPFKARPLNRKIFESKGDMGMFCNMKKQVTVPQEFHFAIDNRIPPQAAVLDLFDKLSINSELHHDKPLPRNTTPNPFNLHTEDRGAEKEMRMAMELKQKQLEEERARIPKANPYPYTTDYPVIPPKPEPKPCTKPEPFQLESLLRHEEEMQREREERKKMEMEEAQRRVFKAQPILEEDPIPVPEKARKPLTEVKEFNLQVDHRAVDRSEFDKKIKDKEAMQKRYREEAESARMMEEEKALKQLRRTLIPHARPVPKFDNPFLPHKSERQVTKAKSPKLHIRGRKEKRRMNVFTSATAPNIASYMR